MLGQLSRQLRWRTGILALALIGTVVISLWRPVLGSSPEPVSAQPPAPGTSTTPPRSATATPDPATVGPSVPATATATATASPSGTAPPTRPGAPAAAGPGSGSNPTSGSGTGVVGAATVTDISLVGSAKVIENEGDTDITEQLPAGTRSGDLILGIVEQYRNSPFTLPAGFTQQTVVSGPDAWDPETVLFWRWSDGSQTSFTVRFPANQSNSVGMAVYRGVNRSSPFAGTATGFNQGGASLTVPGVTAPARAKLVLLVGVCSNDTPLSWTGNPAGMTRRASGESDPWLGLVIYDQTAAAGATGSRTVSMSAAAFQAGILIALRTI
jgi:hypothetical protein